MSKIIGVDGHSLETDDEKEQRLQARKEFEARVEFALTLEAAGLLMEVAKVPAKLASAGMDLDQYRNSVAQSLIKLVGAEAFETRFKVKLLIGQGEEVLPPLPGNVVAGMFPKRKRTH